MLSFLCLALITVPGPQTAANADRVRIQAHLQRTEAALRERDVAELPEELRAERARNLDRLHRYWTAGVFPRNDEFLGIRIPYFIDHSGRACAVGQLMVDSGAVDLAEQIARDERNDRLADITTPGVPAWVAQSGLTVEECATIQPAYCGCGDELDPVCGVDGMTYPNPCIAETCAEVEIDHAGECKGNGESGDGESAGATTSGGGEATGSSTTDAAGSTAGED